MNFIADLHIHSRFSRATSKQLSPRHLAAWARCKGINVLGTGDFTHPQWRDELRRQLVRDEASGLYRLSGPAEELDFLQGKTPPDADGPLFLLQTEISSIYKRQGKVRKVHNLIFVPTLDDADRLSQRLELVGNLHSDGRPILGLDSRDLLEMTLDVCPEAVLIPAHVWTPWFALFGSKSGFDRLEDCFDDLSSHIFALETGLSSDPGMNRMVSQLDGYALISNSDAHSGANLGREANFFAGAPSYDGIFAALRAAARRLPPDRQPQDCRFLGTMEFYPEEGKYHLDGHRACGVVLEPREALALDNICPVCGKPLTIGVLHRVCELADRETPASLLHEPEARPLIPLPELVGEILGVGSGSRKVQDKYAALLRELGPDLDILCRMDEEQVQLMKRRGGVGHDLSELRPTGTPVLNSALTSTGIVPFMERYSNSTREVAQDGRRGALMLSLSIKHPDAERFIDAKVDTGKVTGANVSIKIDDDFMRAALAGKKYHQQFPIKSDNPKYEQDIDARKLWEKIIHNAWKSAEPGVLFWDTIIRESVPAAVRRAEGHPARRTFQALRIDVNHEFEVLYEFMEKLPGALKPGGRVAILTFHSGEDKLVKQALKEGYRNGIYADYAKDVIRPSAEECVQNGRARSTKMRWAIRVEE